MSNIYIFMWGLLATLMAIGPLAFAWYMDKKEKTKAIDH